MASLGARDEPRASTEERPDRLYQQPRPNVKIVRILTVLGYVFCVSSAAIMLSLYYVFLWEPHSANMSACDAYIQKAQRLNQVTPGASVDALQVSSTPSVFPTSI